MANFLGLYDLFQRQQRQSSRSPLERDFEQTRPRQPSLSPLEREFERTRPRRPSRSPLERDFEETRRRPSEQDPFDYDAYMREYESERIEDEEGYEIDYDDPDAYLDDIGRSEDPWADDYEILEERLPRDDNETRDDEQWAPWDDDPEVLGLWQPLGWDEYQRLTGPQAPRGGLPDDPNETRDDEQWDAWGAPKAVAGNPYWDEYQRLTGRFPRRSEDAWADDPELGRSEEVALPGDDPRDDATWDAWGAPKAAVPHPYFDKYQEETGRFPHRDEDPWPDDYELGRKGREVALPDDPNETRDDEQWDAWGSAKAVARRRRQDEWESAKVVAVHAFWDEYQRLTGRFPNRSEDPWADDVEPGRGGGLPFDANETRDDAQWDAWGAPKAVAGNPYWDEYQRLTGRFPGRSEDAWGDDFEPGRKGQEIALPTDSNETRDDEQWDAWGSAKAVAVHAFWDEYQRLTGRFPRRSQDSWADDPEPGYDHDDRGGLPDDPNETRDDEQWDAWGAPKRPAGKITAGEESDDELTPEIIENIYYAKIDDDPLSLTFLEYDIVYGRLRPDFAGGPRVGGGGDYGPGGRLSQEGGDDRPEARLLDGKVQTFERIGENLYYYDTKLTLWFGITPQGETFTVGNDESMEIVRQGGTTQEAGREIDPDTEIRLGDDESEYYAKPGLFIDGHFYYYDAEGSFNRGPGWYGTFKNEGQGSTVITRATRIHHGGMVPFPINIQAPAPAPAAG